MRVHVTATGLASFDDPAGFMTPRDRDELNRRRAEAQTRVENRRTAEADAALAASARNAEEMQVAGRDAQ